MRKLAIFSAAFGVAAAVYVYWMQDIRALWLAGVCLLLSVCGRFLGLRRICAAALGAAVGLMWCCGYHQIWLAPVKNVVGENRVVEVQVETMPQGARVGMTADVRLVVEGRSFSGVLYAEDALPEAQPGDWLRCVADVSESACSVEMGERLYHRSNGNVLVLFASEAEIVRHDVPAWTTRVQQWLQERIDSLYTGHAGALLRALITGDRTGLSYGLQNELSVAGLSHTIAVSGMHVSMLLTMVSLLCGGSPRLTAVVGVPMVLLFALMTGASPSVCRAAVMQILLLCAPLAHREYDPFTTLAFAAMVLLMGNPWAIASVSFQLSFAAVAGLFVLFEPILSGLLGKRRKERGLRRFFAAQIASTLSATVFTMPLTVLYFGQLSIVAPLTNVLVLWAVTGVFTLGLTSCFLGAAGSVLAWVVTKLAAYILGMCGWFAQFPFAAAYPHNLPLMLWAGCAGLTAVVMVMRKRLIRWTPAVLAVAFLLCILTGSGRFHRGNWALTMLDVGQGQCLVVRIGDYTAVVDCGGTYIHESGEQAARLLHSAGETGIDALILTHYDEDHTNGVLQLMDRVEVNCLFLPAVEDESGVRTSLEASGKPVILVESLTEIEVPNGKIRLYPSIFGGKDNNNGLCVLATAGEYDMLITGDLDRFGEMQLLSRWELPDVELLVAGHHGAADATSQVLLEHVRPETVLISVSADNPYGQPAAETLARMEEIGAVILRTDQNGTIVQAGG